MWKGEVKPGFSEHIYRYFRIPFAEYATQVAGNFNPVEFDADKWVRILKGTGMEYLVITAKHHDGFAMWPSAIGEWDIDEASPYESDPIGALKEACDRHGVHLGDQRFRGQVETQPVPRRQDPTLYPEHELRTVRLKPGHHKISITAERIEGKALMEPQGIVLYPQ